MSVSFQCAEGSKLSDLDDYTVTRSGYTFDGWYEGNTKYTADSIMPSRNLNLVAKWSGGTSFSFTLGSTYGPKINRVIVYDGETEVQTYWSPETSTNIECSPGNTIVFYHDHSPQGTQGIWRVSTGTYTTLGAGLTCAMTVPSSASGHATLKIAWSYNDSWAQYHDFLIPSSTGWCQSDKLNFRLWSS